MSKIEQQLRNSPNLVTTKSGRLGWVGEFPENKEELSVLMDILTESYIETGGTITYK